MSASPSTPPGDIAGRYAVERELGRGATAIVYLARDGEHDRPVAIKVLRQEFAESLTAERFLREIHVTAQLHHPHIVPVLDSGAADGRLYFVLPYMDGGTLRDRLRDEKQLAIPDVIAIGTSVLAALGFAHERKLLHRDVKPENILFSGGQACLSDFGIARAMERPSSDGTTSTGLVRGTPAYMSPEQAAGDRDVDARSDLYALACVLYEALAGVPAFVGATPQAVVAQRITHEPRGVRVYRPSVSPALEAVLVKALATTPADRYQTAQEFSHALTNAPAITTPEMLESRGLSRRGRFIAIGLAAAAIGLIGLSAMRPGLFSRFADATPLDTTRIAILPFEGATQTPDSSRPEDLLFEGFRRWRGLELVQSFELGDAIRRQGTPSGNNEQQFVRQFGAGRFVRGRIEILGDRRRIRATLVDTRSGQRLHDVEFIVPVESIVTIATYRRLADSILLRSQRPDSPLDTADAGGSLPGTQTMIRAQAALREWDLAAAESLYVKALEFEPTSARAALWIAQLRAWQEKPNDSWAALARLAASDTNNLAGIERELAPPLALFGDRDFAAACDLYGRMVRRNPRSFVGWYGFASCLDADDAVLPDSSTEARWRFRASYQQTVNAYVRAFQLLPSVYQNYQGNAYSRLRAFLFTSTRYRRVGRTLDRAPKYFTAVPVLDGDTLVLVPQPVEQTLSGRSAVDPSAAAAALTRSRALFRQITSGWAAALPKSPGAKEALGVSLELQADPAAMDTVRSALALSTDRYQRLRLTATLVWLQLKFGIPDDLRLMNAARNTADSVLRHTETYGPREAGLLSRFAAVAGRCELAGRYAREAAVALRHAAPIPQVAMADADERAALLTMGCPLRPNAPTLDRIIDESGVANQPKPVQEMVETFLLARIVRGADSLDRRWSTSLAQRDPLIATRLMIERNQPDSARRRMALLDSTRRFAVRGDVTPDATFPESRVLLALGDTSLAVAWLDRGLAASRFLPPLDAEQSADNVVMVASLIRSVALRSQLSPTAAERARWRAAFNAMWGAADNGPRMSIDKTK